MAENRLLKNEIHMLNMEEKRKAREHYNCKLENDRLKTKVENLEKKVKELCKELSVILPNTNILLANGLGLTSNKRQTVLSKVQAPSF